MDENKSKFWNPVFIISLIISLAIVIYAVGFKDYTGEYYYEMDAKTGVILEKSKPSS